MDWFHVVWIIALAVFVLEAEQAPFCESATP